MDSVHSPVIPLQQYQRGARGDGEPAREPDFEGWSPTEKADLGAWTQSGTNSPGPEGGDGSTVGRSDGRDGPADVDAIRATLLPFFICYAPQRLMDIPALIRRYSGEHATVRTLVARCRAEFKMQPVEREAQLCIEKDTRTRLYCYFAYYDWSRMERVDTLAHKYRGMERELWQALERKYGPETPPYQLFTGMTPAEIRAREDAALASRRIVPSPSGVKQSSSLSTPAPRMTPAPAKGTPQAGDDGKSALWEGMVPEIGSLRGTKSIIQSVPEPVTMADYKRVLDVTHVDIGRSWRVPRPASSVSSADSFRMDPSDFGLL
jgi:hypothetical protein